MVTDKRAKIPYANWKCLLSQIENPFLLKARLKAAEPTEPQGSAQRWRSGYAKRNVCGASYGSGEKNKNNSKKVV